VHAAVSPAIGTSSTCSIAYRRSEGAVISVLLAFVGLIVLLATTIGVYYLVSFLTLYAVGRLFPLAGRRRRDSRGQ